MKQFICLMVFVFCLVNIRAQEQVIPDPYLKVVKKGGLITISDTGNDYSVSFPGDTVYRIMPYEIMIAKKGDKFGIFNPWDMEWMAEPVYSYIGPFTEELIVVRKKGKYSIVAPFEDGFEKPYVTFDTLYPFTPMDEEVYNNMYMYLLEFKGKYGLYNIWDYTGAFLPIKFDEIILIASHENGIVYKMRKGKKWGAGDCETYETKIAYEEIDWLTGECSYNFFRIRKQGKFGIVATGIYGKYLYPPEFDKVSFVGEWIGNGYFILKKGNKWDVIDDTFPPFEPRYDNVHILKTEGLTRISMETNGEIYTLEIEY